MFAVQPTNTSSSTEIWSPHPTVRTGCCRVAGLKLTASPTERCDTMADSARTAMTTSPSPLRRCHGQRASSFAPRSARPRMAAPAWRRGLRRAGRHDRAVAVRYRAARRARTPKPPYSGPIARANGSWATREASGSACWACGAGSTPTRVHTCGSDPHGGRVRGPIGVADRPGSVVLVPFPAAPDQMATIASRMNPDTHNTAGRTLARGHGPTDKEPGPVAAVKVTLTSGAPTMPTRTLTNLQSGVRI